MTRVWEDDNVGGAGLSPSFHQLQEGARTHSVSMSPSLLMCSISVRPGYEFVGQKDKGLLFFLNNPKDLLSFE